MKSILLITAILLSFSALSQELKIGYIDADYLINNYSKFKSIQQQIIKESNVQKEKIQKQAKDIQSMVNKFNQEKANLTKMEKEKTISKIKKLDTGLQEKATKIQQELKVKSKKALNKIQKKINQVIKDFAVSNKLDLVLYKDVAYVSKSIDITSKIAAILKNKK